MPPKRKNDDALFLEAFSPLYQQACDFLVAIAKPESRPEFIHIYRLTENSLNAAVALSIDADSIIKVLTRLCKTKVPKEVIRFNKDSTQRLRVIFAPSMLSLA